MHRTEDETALSLQELTLKRHQTASVRNMIDFEARRRGIGCCPRCYCTNVRPSRRVYGGYRPQLPRRSQPLTFRCSHRRYVRAALRLAQRRVRTSQRSVVPADSPPLRVAVFLPPSRSAPCHELAYTGAPPAHPTRFSGRMMRILQG